jgi:hypothetical protein
VRVHQLLWPGLTLAAVLCLAAAPAHAQGKEKHKDKHHYVVSGDRAVSVTRTVLVDRGYEVIRVEQVGPTRVVYYRLGKKWRGRGRRPVHRMVIRTVDRRVVFEEAEPSVLVDIDVKLKL